MILDQSAYLNERLNAIGITDEINTFTQIKRIPVVGGPTEEFPEQSKFFTSDRDGNIIIHYFNLNSETYKWKPEDSTRKPFTRKRLQNPKENQKYHQEKGSGQFPFFTPGIIQKYQLSKAKPDSDPNAGNIDTLILVEGEFKAFAGYLAGLDIIGIPSIHGFYNGDVAGKLHDDIKEVIITCKVKNIIFLVDADLLSVKWEANKDLAKRIESFYTAVKLFRESLEILIQNPEINLTNIFFSHIESKYMKESKGLDDLLINQKQNGKEIIADLLQFQYANKFFHGLILNDPNRDLLKIRNYLGLVDEQSFYKTYKEFIGSRSFLFKNKHYTYNVEEDKVIFERHADADKYMRVGSNWIKKIERLNKHGKMIGEMIPWSISEIIRDYKLGKSADYFISQLPKYDSFCNEPNWTNEYKRVHNNCYNLVEPLTWSPAEGLFPNTYKLLKHIFQGNGRIEFGENGVPMNETCITADPFTLIMDWLSILFKNPKQMLPVPILVSKEQGTGKTTFLKWLNVLFGSNMVILGNEQFKMKFNGHYISKFIIAIDEGFLDVDKKAEKERLKQLVTADTAYLENKGMNVERINFYGKLIICSNDADRIMKIDEGESRWFVVKVPVIPNRNISGREMLKLGYDKYQDELVDPEKTYSLPDIDPDLERKMEQEAPAVINYLFKRNIHHPRVNRLWFDPAWFITEQFKAIVENTKNRVDRVFEDWIKDQFLTYRVTTLRYPISHLTEVFNDPKNSKYRIDAIELKLYLTERKKLKAGPPERVKIPVGFDDSDSSFDSGKIIYKSIIARAYIFHVEEWLNEIEMEEWKKPLTITNSTSQADVTTFSKSETQNKNSDDLPF